MLDQQVNDFFSNYICIRTKHMQKVKIIIFTFSYRLNIIINPQQASRSLKQIFK